MKKITLRNILIGLSSVLPSLAQAQAFQGLKSLLTSFGGLINKAIPVIFGICLVYFFWGLSQFILHDAGNDKTREDGKKKMIWGIVALFVFISIYGILRLIGELIGLPIQTGPIFQGDAIMGGMNI